MADDQKNDALKKKRGLKLPKFWLFLPAVIVLIGAGVGLFINLTTQSALNNSHQLSARAKEFVQNQKKVDSNYKKTDPNPQPEAPISKFGQLTSGDCFTITIPFPVSENRQEGKCLNQLFITSPKGRIVVYQQSASESSLDETSAITMRRQKKDTYEESSRTVQNKQFLLYKNKQINYEKSAFFLSKNQLFVLNLIVDTNENLDDQFNQMLDSVRIN